MGNYLSHLLNSINSCRETSIKEFYNTDLNSGLEIMELMNWYDTITSMVTESPPSYYVKNLVIVENTYDAINSVEYVYSQHGEEIHNATFTIRIEQ